MPASSAAANTSPALAKEPSTAMLICHRSTKKWKSLWKEDLLPYRKLRKDLPMVMVAHASYPDVTGDKLPASLSKVWMHDILKKKIGFKGLIVSDDLEMGGVLAAAPIGEAAIQTLQAGSDLMLVCHKEEHVWLAFESVYKLAEADRSLPASRQEIERVLEFKRKSRSQLARTPARPTPRTVDKLCRRIWEFTEEVRLTQPLRRGRDRRRCFEGARLHRLRKNPASRRLASGHDLGRADKPFFFLIASGL